MRRLLLCTALSFGILPVFAADQWDVRTTLRHEGAVFASPSLVVRDGEPAVVEVSGDAGFRLELTVTDGPDGAIRIATQLQSVHGDAAPILVTMPGETAEVRIGALGMDLLVTPAVDRG
ncbi:MAG: hypothetical protein ABW163_02870 [Luteimonas sp.]